MKTIFYTIGAAFAILLITACETVVEVELPQRESKLVLNSLFSTDSNFLVTLSKSKGILEAGDLEYVHNGHIEIRGSDGSYVQLTGSGVGSGPPTLTPYQYYIPLQPKTNITYSIKASAPGVESVTASNVLPSAVAIERIDTSTVRLFDTEEKQVSLTFTDPGNVANFYEVKLYYLIHYPVLDSNGQIVGTVPYVQEIPSYISTEGLFSEGIDERVFTDELFNGRPFTVRLGFDQSYIPIIEGDSGELPDFPIFLIGELRSTSEDYYKFNSSYLRYQSSVNDPFAQPAQVFNNVEGGFGIFAGYSSARDTMQVN